MTLTTTSLMPDRLLHKIYRDLIDLKTLGRLRIAFEQFLDETDTRESIQEKLATEDRRKPAYIQLRNAWDTMDRISQKEAVSWILQKTMTDPLSGLETLVAKELSGQKPARWVEALSDLNALKAINDTWGHATGDQVIQELGKIINAEVVQAGGRAFRMGGDEISYWFPDLKKAKQTLAAIDSTFQAKEFVIGGENRKGFSISYGIGFNAVSADRALYRDKEHRKRLGQRSERGHIPESIISSSKT